MGGWKKTVMRETRLLMSQSHGEGEGDRTACCNYGNIQQLGTSEKSGKMHMKAIHTDTPNAHNIQCKIYVQYFIVLAIL